MGRPRRYATAAEKQRAYRQRRGAEMVEVNRASLEALEARLQRLQASVSAAAATGHALAVQIEAPNVSQLLDALSGWFEAEAAARQTN